VVALQLCGIVHAQDLAPRAYIITPIHSNAVTLSYGFYSGQLDYNGAFPIENATGRYNVPVFGLFHSFNFFGRSANVNVSLPYGVGNFQGSALGRSGSVYRSGLFDCGIRLSVNLKGGPAMSLPQFAKWKQKVLLGASLKVIAPTGQYSPNAVINWGTNRWSFKPEFGYSKRWTKIVLDGYAGAWFFTTNPQFISIPPPPRPQTLSPIGSLEGHLSYDAKPRFWVSLDGNFWYGGASTVAGVKNDSTKQTSSRVGVTASLPLNKHQAIKVSYSAGAFVRFGGDYQNVAFAWQYSWFGRPQ
jgi:hypothetical protein